MTVAGPDRAAALLEKLASAVMAADASDGAAVGSLVALLEELGATGHPAATPACGAAGAIRAVLHDEAKLAGALDAASEAIASMQEAMSRAPAAPAEAPILAADPGALVLPEWGDEKTLRDFLAALKSGLEELEEGILGMEQGAAEPRAAFKRRLHTMKGEAGVLGLEDLEAVCHATEDFVEARGMSADTTDRLLKVRDWMARAGESYARLRKPEQRAAALVAEVLAPSSSPERAVDAAAAAAPPHPDPSRAPAAAPATSKVERDAETVSLFGEFLSESAEGLNRVDQALMTVESEGVTPDTVNGLFRVFHTVKGTAGFLDLDEVVSLAHHTETMLNKCRENELELAGPVIDLVFDATTGLREMLETVRVAIEAGTAFPRREGLAGLVHRIEEATEGRATEETPIASPTSNPEAIATANVNAISTSSPNATSNAASNATSTSTATLTSTAAPKPAEEAGPVKLKDTIKVDLERVDSLVEMIGELVVVESMVVNAPEISQASSVQVRNCLGQLAKVTRDLQDVGMRMRMVPVAGVFQKMARLVRDLSRKSGKQVRLVTSGESTEMDRSMVEQIADPLVHMIRNSCDHGLEPSDVREKAGKSPVGIIKLSAYHEGGSVVIEIADDGRGLDQAAIVKKAVERGLIPSADGMSEAEINSLIFAPGFSTAAKVTEISGRGVGMDVVKRNIEAMRGRVVIASTLGKGTTFKLVLPLTLAIIDGMLVACGNERYIIPTLSIVESIQPERKMLVSLGKTNEMINLRGEILPLLRLDRLFGLSGAKADPTEALVVVVEGVGRRIGLLVDEVVTQQQVVIKSLGEGLGRTQFISGAAILSDGRVGLILNVEEIAGLVHRSREYLRERVAQSSPPEAAPPHNEGARA